MPLTTASKGEFPPTDEQQKAMDLFIEGLRLVIEAGAGTGKTTLLGLLAKSKKNRKGLYVAFNKEIVLESKAKMPSWVRCSTAHGLAYGITGSKYQHRMNRKSSIRNDTAAEILGIKPIQVTMETSDGTAELVLHPRKLMYVINKALKSFCNSMDDEPDVRHFSYIDGIDRPSDGRRTYHNNKAVVQELFPYLLKAWKDINRLDGMLNFYHDHYLKIYALTRPQWPVEYVLFDEAQDASPVMLGMVMGQKNSQIVCVGDSQQQIYSWRGAINALAEAMKFQGTAKTFLTQSFRFGPEIAEVANQILSTLEAELRLVGFDKIKSRVGIVESPKCILARTNAGALGAFIASLDEGQKPYLMGGQEKVDELVSFAKAARKLMDGQSTDHSQLWAFKTWSAVREYVEEGEGDDIAPWVRLLDQYDPDIIIECLDPMIEKRKAGVVVGTGHKAKGSQFPSVRVERDFPPLDNNDIGQEELRLEYVAVTRAQYELDITAILNSAGYSLDG